MDLSSLSNADLLALHNGDLSKVSDSGLKALHGMSQQTPTMPKEEPSMLEAGLRGAENGALLGAAPAVNGGLSALLDQLSGNNKGLSLLDDYNKQRQESLEAQNSASSAHPYAYGAGTLAGGVAPALLTGGGSLAEQGALGAAKMGASYGAASGLGNALSNGEDLGQTAKDVALSGAGGAVLAPAAGMLASGAKNALGLVGSAVKGIGGTAAGLDTISNIAPSFTQAIGGTELNPQGRNLIGKKGQEAMTALVQERIGDGTDTNPGTIPTLIQSYLNKQQLTKTNMLRDAGTLDVSPLVSGINDAMSAFAETPQGQSPQAESAMQQLKDKMQRYFYPIVGKDEEGNAIREFMPSQQASNVDAFKGELQRMGLNSMDSSLPGPENTYARALMQNLSYSPDREASRIEQSLNMPDSVYPIQDFLHDSVPGLQAVDTSISDATKSLNQVPSIQTALSSEKPGMGGIAPKVEIGKLANTLPDDLAPQVMPMVDDLGQAAEAFSGTTKRGLGEGLLGTSVGGRLSQGANAVGSGLRWMYNATPDVIKNLAGSVQQVAATSGDATTKQTATALGNILSQAGDRDQLGRNALFFAVEQNPAYREMLHNVIGTAPDNKQSGITRPNAP